MALDITPSIKEDNGSGGAVLYNNPPVISTSGTPLQKEYDVYYSSQTYKSSMYFQRKGIGNVTIRIQDSESMNLKISKIELLVGDKVAALIRNFGMTEGSPICLGYNTTGFYRAISFDLDSTEYGAYDFDIYRRGFKESVSETLNCSMLNAGGVGQSTSQLEIYSFEKNYFTEPGEYNVSLKVTYKYTTATTEFTTSKDLGKITVFNPVMDDLWVVTGNMQTKYQLNDPFDYENMVVKASYSHYVSDFHAVTVEVLSYSMTTPNMAVKGNQPITVSYGDFDYTFQISIEVIEITTLEVNFSSITNKAYYVNNTVDLSGVTGLYSITVENDSEFDEYPIEVRFPEDDELIFTFMDKQVTNSFTLPSVSGEFVLKAKYVKEGITLGEKEQVITVLESVVTGLVVKTNPTKALNSYVEGQPLNLTGLKLEVTFGDTSANTTYEYNNETIIYYLGDEEIARNKALTLADTGKTLKAKIDDLEVTIGTLIIDSKRVVSVAVQSSPNLKTTYTYGDTMSFEGLILRATFNDGEIREIRYPNNAITSSFMDKTFGEEDTLGTTNIDVKCTIDAITVTTSFPIELVKPVAKEIYIDTTYATTTFDNKSVFSTGGLAVYVVYENGYKCKANTFTTNAKTVLNLPEDDSVDQIIDCTGSYGDKTIEVIGYDKFSTATVKGTYVVQVYSSSQVISAYLVVDETATNYYVGDTFTAKGIKIHTIDADGDEADVSNFSTTPAIGTILRTAQKLDVYVTYSKGEFVYTTSYAVNVNIKNINNLVSDNDYKIAKGANDGTLFQSLVTKDATIKLGIQADGSCLYPIFHENLVEIDNNPDHTNTYGYNIYVGNNADKDCIGYMDLGLQDKYGNLIRNAHVILFEDINNPIEGDGNIVVTFPHYIRGYSDRINKCKFGKVYNKRLFLSGNPEYKNCDWHSGDINVAQIESYNMDSTKDFTYFSDLDYCRYGSDETAVVGYDIYRDGDLIVFKETSRSEATLYKRTSSLINAVDYAGNVLDNSLIEEAYPCFDINSNGGEGSFTPRTIVNFVGDTLFLTRNGLKVLSSKETTSNNAKYAYDVSTYINTKITNEDLVNARLFTFKERLILKTKRGIYYGEYNLRNDNNEYEWYYIDNVNADLFFEIDNELYFADNNGNFYKFKTNASSYVDTPRTFVSNGGVLLCNDQDEENPDLDGDGFAISETENAILISNNYASEVVEGRDFHLITTYTNNNVDTSCLMHASMGSFINKHYKGSFNKEDYVGEINTDYNSPLNNTISLFETSDVFDLYYEGRKVYLDKITTDGVKHVFIDTPYTLKKALDEPLDYSYYLIDENGNIANLLGVNSMRLSIIVNELEIAKITNVREYRSGGKVFNLIGDHDKLLDVIFYNDRNDRYSGVITDKLNIEAYYRTKPYNMGTTLYEKTVWSWSIVNDSGVASSTDIGYITSRKQKGFNLVMDSNEFETTGFDFSKVQFTNNEAPYVYVKNRILANITFIEFVFKNDSDSNMVLSQFSLLYSQSQFTRGVK